MNQTYHFICKSLNTKSSTHKPMAETNNGQTYTCLSYTTGAYNIPLHIRKINPHKLILATSESIIITYILCNTELSHLLIHNIVAYICSLPHNITFFNFVHIESSLCAFLFLNGKFIYLHEEKLTYKLSKPWLH